MYVVHTHIHAYFVCIHVCVNNVIGASSEEKTIQGAPLKDRQGTKTCMSRQVHCWEVGPAGTKH